MEITFTAGVRTGEHLHFDETVISIGRELDNLVMVPMAGVSRHHAQIRLENNQWRLYDLGSSNGVKLNERQIAMPTPLNEGDRVDICGQVFCVRFRPPVGTVIFKPFNDAAAALSPEEAAKRAMPSGYVEPPATPGQTVPLNKPSTDPDRMKKAVQYGDVNLFSGPATEHKRAIPKHPPTDAARPGHPAATPRRRRAAGWLFYLWVIGLAAIVVCTYVFLSMESQQGTAAAAPAAVQQDFVLRYEREKVEKDNIFRYTLTFEKGVANFRLDDLRSNRAFQKEIANISAESLQELLNSVEQSGIFSLPKNPAQGQTPDGQYEERRLLIVTPTRQLDYTVLNDTVPEAFATVEQLLQEFADANQLQTISMTPEELKEQAKRAYDNARNYYENYSGHPENLLKAIRNYQLALEYLEPFTPKPKIYEDARKQLQELTELHRKTVASLKLEIQRLSKLEDYNALETNLQQLRALSDPGSRDDELARKNLLKIEELRNQNFRR